MRRDWMRVGGYPIVQQIPDCGSGGVRAMGRNSLL
jgi:hypothetical protein